MASQNNQQPAAPVRRRLIRSSTDEPPTVSLTELRERQKRENKEKFLVSLRKHLGIITYACEETGIGRRTVYNWMSADTRFMEEVKGIDDRQADFVERKLMELVNGHGKPGDADYIPPNSKAVIFYLATKGKRKGYTNRIEVSTPPGEPMEVNASVDVRSLREDMGDAALAKALGKVLSLCPDALSGLPPGPLTGAVPPEVGGGA